MPGIHLFSITTPQYNVSTNATICSPKIKAMQRNPLFDTLLAAQCAMNGTTSSQPRHDC
jgi:hypothetical protein